MSWWLIFVFVLGGVVLHAYLARWVAGFFVQADKRNIAGFCFVLGMTFSAFGPVVDMGQASSKLAASSGYLCGLFIVWFLFFKREKANG